jgi:hypothetical protein
MFHMASTTAAHAAPGRWRASVALSAACWSQDTIPKPGGLAGRVRGLEPNRNRTEAGRCPALFEPGPARVRERSAVGFGAVEDGVNVEGAGRVLDEADAIVADAQAQIVGVALELLDVALAGAGEVVERGEDAHGGVAVDAAHIGARGWGEDDLFHAREPVSGGGLRG